MRAVVLALLVLVSVITQGTVLSAHPMGIPTVDVLLVVTVTLSILRGPASGAALGLFSGLVEDAAYGRPLGISSMSRMLVCWTAGHLESKVFKENLLIPGLAVFVITIFDRALMAVFVRMIGVQPGSPWGLSSHELRGATVNAVSAILLYTPLFRLSRPGMRGRRSGRC